MGCEIALDKAAVIASEQRLANGIARGLGARAGSASQRIAAVNLGFDFAPARRRTSHRFSGKRSKRYAALAKRGRKLSGIRKVIGGTKRAKRLFTTGLLAAAVPDAAVHGVSDREALILRRTAALACSPRARGRSLALVTMMNDVPTWRAETEIVLQYARQVWAAASLGPNASKKGTYGLTSSRASGAPWKRRPCSTPPPIVPLLTRMLMEMRMVVMVMPINADGQHEDARVRRAGEEVMAAAAAAAPRSPALRRNGWRRPGGRTVGGGTGPR